MYVYKLIVLVLLASITVVFTHCGSPFSSQSQLSWKSNIYGGADEVSYNAFEATVYPITRANCASCHMTQSPKHASDNVKEAHDEIMMTQKVNFSNIPGSRMVRKLRDENHNCWSNCADNAAEMQAAIEEWNDAIKDSGPAPVTPTPGVPAPVNIKTAQTKTIAEELASSANALKSNTVAINVGSAMVSAPMVKAVDAFGDYLHVPDDGSNQTLVATEPSAGLALMNITLPAAGSYRVFGLVVAPDANTNAFYLGLSPMGTQNYIGGIRTVDLQTNANQIWRQMSNTFAVPSAGNYTLTLRERRDGTKIYRIFVTADPAFDVTDVASFLGKTLTFDVSLITKVPGTQFKIDVTDYDMYTYLLAKPRIVSTSNIRVKGLRLFVNNVRTALQAYSTFDVTTTPANGLISGFNMQVLKEGGPAIDKFHFEFEALEVATAPVNNASLTAFQSSVYVITRANCASCHAAQFPHASADPMTAHNEAVRLTNFTTPANSLLVTKIRNGHQGQSTALAAQLEAAIIQWRTGRTP